MQQFLNSLFGVLLMFCLVTCGNAKSIPKETDAEVSIVNSIRSEDTQDNDIGYEVNSLDTKKRLGSNMKSNLKLYINEKEIPVIWEKNDSVIEIMEEASKGEIFVSMSMYSDNEQVGSLGKSYTRNDKRTTTHNGDIVLYSGNNIVLFYGSNSWSYTRLGKMDLSEADVTKLLSNGNVSVRLTLTKN